MPHFTYIINHGIRGTLPHWHCTEGYIVIKNWEKEKKKPPEAVKPQKVLKLSNKQSGNTIPIVIYLVIPLLVRIICYGFWSFFATFFCFQLLTNCYFHVIVSAVRKCQNALLNIIMKHIKLGSVPDLTAVNKPFNVPYEVWNNMTMVLFLQ